MLATVANRDNIAKVQSTGLMCGALANGLYGAYGQSSESSDGRQEKAVVALNRHRRGAF